MAAAAAAAAASGWAGGASRREKLAEMRVHEGLRVQPALQIEDAEKGEGGPGEGGPGTPRVSGDQRLHHLERRMMQSPLPASEASQAHAKKQTSQAPAKKQTFGRTI